MATQFRQREQMALEEIILKDADLKALLDGFFEAKGKQRTSAEEMKSHRRSIEQWLPPEEAVGKSYRIGPYVLEGRMSEEKEVGFTREAKAKLVIKRPNPRSGSNKG